MQPNLAGLEKHYPFRSHFLEVDGQRMHYVDEGDGPAVLMLHGNPTWSFFFRELIKGLRDRFRVVAPDHIGCGLSDKPQNYDYTLASHIDNVERLLERTGLRDVTLAVHDWGGPIGFGVCARLPELVRRFVVFNTAAFFGPCPLRIRICRWPVLGEIIVRRLNGFARGAIRTACKRRERMTADVKRGYLLPYGNRADRVAIFRFVRDIPLLSADRSHPVVAEIEASLAGLRDRPMLLLWGARDFCFNDWYLRQWIARFPHAAVHRFEDAGHYVVEDAHERILPLMRKFLSADGD